MNKLRPSRDAGFTLFEVLIVLVVLAFLGGTAIPHLGATMDERTLEAAALDVRSMILYARGRSIGGVPHAFVTSVPLQTMTDMDLEAAGNTPDPWKKDGSNFKFTFIDGGSHPRVSLVSADFGGSSEVTFNALGKPSSGGTVVLSLGGMTRTVRVKAMTGEVVLE